MHLKEMLRLQSALKNQKLQFLMLFITKSSISNSIMPLRKYPRFKPNFKMSTYHNNSNNNMPQFNTARMVKLA